MTAPPVSKPKASPKKPGRKPGTPAKEWDFSGLTLEALTTPVQVTPELSSLTAPMRARDARQVAVDKIVADAHADWTNAGRPDLWSKMPKVARPVPPQSADTYRMLVRRAANFMGISVKFGKPVRNAEGLEIVVFAARDARARQLKDKSSWTLEEIREIVSEYFGVNDDGAASDFLSFLENGDETSESPGSEAVGSAVMSPTDPAHGQ